MFDDLIKGTALENMFLGNRLADYLLSLIIVVVGIIAVMVFRRLAMSVIRRFTRDKTEFYNLLETSFKKSIIPAVYIGLVYFSVNLLNLQPKFSHILNSVTIIIITYFSIKFLITLIKYIIVSALDRKDASLTQTQAYRAMFPALQIVVWSIGLTFVLGNLGLEISSIIAGLGIGGIAIALAAQAVFKDFFSYIAIVLDKPFEIGDFIIVDTFMGSVEHIGIKTTRLRSISGEQLIFSNSNLTDSRIKNYQKMQSRRAVFNLSVVYETPVDKIREIPQIIRRLVENYPDTVFDRSHFSAYGESGLMFETVYFVTVADYKRFMDIQQEIYLSLNEEFASRGIEFAYNTRRLVVDNTPPAGGKN